MSSDSENVDVFREGLLNRDSKVIQQLYNDLLPKVRNLASPQLSVDDAWDALQEGVILVYQRLQEDRLEVHQPVKNYIFGVCRLILRKKTIKIQSGKVTLLGDEVPIIEDEYNLQAELTALERHKLYQEKLAALGERCQQLLALYLQKISLLKIRERMGYASEDAVKQQKFKCKKQLIDFCRKDPRYKTLV
jgi:RNA polymerase sigma factor (sigma-70 family)